MTVDLMCATFLHVLLKQTPLQGGQPSPHSRKSGHQVSTDAPCSAASHQVNNHIDKRIKVGKSAGRKRTVEWSGQVDTPYKQQQNGHPSPIKYKPLWCSLCGKSCQKFRNCLFSEKCTHWICPVCVAQVRSNCFKAVPKCNHCINTIVQRYGHRMSHFK